MSKQIICIKARSHSDFELYLIGEKYDIPYDFLLNYKKNKRVYKFWTEVGSGLLSAIEERPNEKTKNFISYAPMSEREKQNTIDIQPIRAGELINKSLEIRNDEIVINGAKDLSVQIEELYKPKKEFTLRSENMYSTTQPDYKGLLNKDKFLVQY